MNQVVYYAQTDARWKDKLYTIDGDKNETIGASGCGPTCAAMILATLVDSKITPVQTCQMAIDMKDRTANNGTEWEYFKHIADSYNLGFEQTSRTDKAIDAIRQGALVVCSMGPGYFTRAGHYILAYNTDGETISVNDPASKVRTGAAVELFKNQCKQYFIFKKPLTNLEKAVRKLQDKGIIQDSKYWVTHAQPDSTCLGEYVGKLIINVANKL